MLSWTWPGRQTRINTDHSCILRRHLSTRDDISKSGLGHRLESTLTTLAYWSAIYLQGMTFLNLTSDHSHLPQCHLSMKDDVLESRLVARLLHEDRIHLSRNVTSYLGHPRPNIRMKIRMREGHVCSSPLCSQARRQILLPDWYILKIDGK